MLLPSLLKSGDQVYQKVIKQLYQKMLLLNLLITLCAFRGKWISSVIRNNMFFCNILRTFYPLKCGKYFFCRIFAVHTFVI